MVITLTKAQEACITERLARRHDASATAAARALTDAKTATRTALFHDDIGWAARPIDEA